MTHNIPIVPTAGRVLTPAQVQAPGEVTERSVVDRPKSWLDFEHPEYTNNVARWAFAAAHYTGDLLHADKLAEFLIQRSTGESDAAYVERQALADYTPHFGQVVDSLAGMLFQVESRATRVFGANVDPSTGLGDPKDVTTAIGRLWKDVDGSGTNYITFWKQLAIELIVSHLTWVLVDTNAAGDQARVKLRPALSVPNWLYLGGRLVEVLITETADERTSVESDDSLENRWIKYTLTGWTRYRKDARGQPVEIDAADYKVINASGERVLPIFPVTLPLRRNVGYSLARKSNVIFNKESERDHLLRVANFPFLNLLATDTQFENITAAMVKGSRVLQNDPANRTGKAHHFISPSAESAEVATEGLKRKVEECYITAFRQYGDAARERVTATEIRQDVSAGVGAFLQMLKSGVDEAENEALYRIAQIELPTSKGRWFVNSVERSEDFVPIDINQEKARLQKTHFGETAAVPGGVVTKVAAAKKIHEWDGLEVNLEELTTAVTMHLLRENVELFASLPIPPEVKAEYTITTMVGLGLLDPDKEVELESGDKAKLIDVVRAKAVAMATAVLPKPPEGSENDGGNT